MHEVTLVSSLIGSLLKILEKSNISRVLHVNISVGKLSNVLPEALVFAFEALTGEGILKGAELKIEERQAVARCEDCGSEYMADGFPFICPVCKSRMFMIISGEEVYIQSVECGEA